MCYNRCILVKNDGLEVESKTPGRRGHPVRRDLRRSPLRLSPTSIALFQQCPQQYKFRYIDKLGPEYQKPRPYFTMANHIHATLKDLMSIDAIEERTAEAARGLLEKNWTSSRLGFADAEDEKRWLDRARKQVERFAHSPYVTARPLLLESPVEALVSVGVMLYGRVDRVDQRPDGSLHIIDYKAARAPATESGSSGQGKSWSQLQFLALILRISRPEPIACVSFLYLEDADMRSRDFSTADLDQARWDLLNVASRIRRERSHLPTPGPWCERCDFTSLCAASLKPQSVGTAPAASGQLMLGDSFFDDL